MRVSNITGERTDVPIVQNETLHDLARKHETRDRWPNHTARCLLGVLRQTIHQIFKFHGQLNRRWILASLYIFEHVHDSGLAQLCRYLLLCWRLLRYGSLWCD